MIGKAFVANVNGLIRMRAAWVREMATESVSTETSEREVSEGKTEALRLALDLLVFTELA
jgi:hypothetical protein